MPVVGICCVFMLSLYSSPAVALATKAGEKQDQPIDDKTVEHKDQTEPATSKAKEKPKNTKARQNNITHFGMGYEQRNRSRGSSRGSSRPQGKGRGR